MAIEGLENMEAWMRELGLAMSLEEVGGRAEDIEGYADATPILTGGYHKLTRDEVIEVFRNSLKNK